MRPFHIPLCDGLGIDSFAVVMRICRIEWMGGMRLGSFENTSFAKMGLGVGGHAGVGEGYLWEWSLELCGSCWASSLRGYWLETRSLRDRDVDIMC